MAVTRADIEGIAAVRDQLWAEAVSAYKAGEEWWPTDEMAQIAARIASARTEDDPWTGAILQYVATKSEVGTRELLEKMDFSRAAMTKTDAKRVAGILRRNGWVPAGQFTSGQDKGSARYIRSRESQDEWAKAVQTVVASPTGS